ncbi:DNA polymerase III subunit tau [Haemophilus influenzae]|nr:DNA polymerase III subunit tau [Haemophilus influenzae]
MVEALSKLQGKDIRLTINLDDSNVATPIEYRRNIYQALREKAQNELQKDSKLQMLLNEFDAKLDVESIRPV